MRRMLLRMNICLAAFGLVGWTSPVHAQAQPETVSVGGVDTRVVTIGIEDRTPGDPAIVLFSGAGSPLEYWQGWPEALAQIGAVVAYDRPGIGGSEYDGRGLSPARVAEHLDDLLATLEVPPPYILVGHSWGGPLMLHYLEGRAERVVGMVYLDPTAPRDLGRETVGAATESQFRALLEVEAAGMAGMSLSDGLLAEFEALDQFRSTAPELRGFPADPEIPTAVVLGRLPSSGGPGFPDFVNEDYWGAAMSRRVSHMGAWVASMARGTLYFTTEAGHNVHIGARELSLQAVRRVWDAAVAR